MEPTEADVQFYVNVCYFEDVSLPRYSTYRAPSYAVVYVDCLFQAFVPCPYAASLEDVWFELKERALYEPQPGALLVYVTDSKVNYYQL